MSLRKQECLGPLKLSLPLLGILLYPRSRYRASELGRALQLPRRHVAAAARRKVDNAGHIPGGIAQELAVELLWKRAGLTTGSAARVLKMKPDRLLQFCKRGQIRSKRIGRNHYIPLVEVRRLQEKLTSQGLLSTLEVAARLGLKPASVADLCHKGNIKSVKIDRRHYISETEVSRLQKAREGYTTTQVGALLGIQGPSVARMCHEGKIRSQQTQRGRHLIPQSEVDRLLAARDTSDYVTIDEVATLLSLNPQTVSTYCLNGEIKAELRRGAYRIHRDELRRFLGLVPLRQAATQIGMAYTNLDHLASKERIPSVRIGSRVYLRPSIVRQLTWERENLLSATELGDLVGLSTYQVKRLGQEGLITKQQRPSIGKKVWPRSQVKVLKRLIKERRVTPIKTVKAAA